MNDNIKANRYKGEDGKWYGTISYASYIGLESETSKPFIMIAELIDNSISSFENELGNWTPNNKLKINIDFNFKYDEKVKCKGNENNEYLRGSYIRVNDNAYGFKKMGQPNMSITDALTNLIEYGQKNRGGSNKNKWGKGLKHCVYYFGQDLKITTSNGNETAELERVFTAEGIDMDTAYSYNAEKVETTANGTEILISNIYKDKAFGKSTFNTIVDALSRRYVKYIEKDLVEISFNIKSDDYSTTEPETLKILEEPVRNIYKQVKDKTNQTVMQLFADPKYRKDFESKIDIEYGKRLSRYAKMDDDDEERVELGLFTQSYKDMKKLMFEYVDKNEENAHLMSTINLSLNDSLSDKEVEVPFTYWILPLHTEEQFSGIRFYEGDRAIRHVCGRDKDIKPWRQYIIRSDDANRTSKKFAGSIDLEKISLETVKDKSNFKMPEDLENKLASYIWSVFKAMEIFMIYIAKTDEKIEIKEEVLTISDSIVQESLKLIKNTSDDGVIYIEEESSDKIFTVSRKYLDKDWKISIELDDKTMAKKKFYFTKTNDRELKVVVYAKNSVWMEIRKNFKDQDSFIKDLISERLQTLILHSLKITSLFTVKDSEITEKVVEVLNELGEDYIGQNI